MERRIARSGVLSNGKRAASAGDDSKQPGDCAEALELVALPASRPSSAVAVHHMKAREQVVVRRSRPFRQRVIAAGSSLTSRDLTLNAGGRHAACAAARDHAICFSRAMLASETVQLGVEVLGIKAPATFRTEYQAVR